MDGRDKMSKVCTPRSDVIRQSYVLSRANGLHNSSKPPGKAEPVFYWHGSTVSNSLTNRLINISSIPGTSIVIDFPVAGGRL